MQLVISTWVGHIIIIIICVCKGTKLVKQCIVMYVALFMVLWRNTEKKIKYIFGLFLLMIVYNGVLNAPCTLIRQQCDLVFSCVQYA